MPSAFPGRVIADSAQIAPGVIVNSDINASAAIVDTKLAQITTASKVSGAALTSLASIPAGAGVIPLANLPGPAATFGQAGLGTATISHGLGKMPAFIKFTAHGRDSGGQMGSSIGIVTVDGSGNIVTSQHAYGNWTSNAEGGGTTAGLVIIIGGGCSLSISAISTTQFTLTVTGGAVAGGVVWECQ